MQVVVVVFRIQIIDRQKELSVGQKFVFSLCLFSVMAPAWVEEADAPLIDLRKAAAPALESVKESF